MQGRYGEAEPLIKRSLAIREKVLGRDHPDVARSLNNLADLYERQARYDDAEPLYRRALAIREAALGPDHPDLVTSLNNLASLYQTEGRGADALPIVQRLIASGRVQPRVALPVLFAAQRQQSMPAEKALDDALNAIQRGAQSSAASAVNKLAVRLAAGSDRLAELVRRDQDLAAEAEALDKAILSAVSKEPSKRDATAEARSRDRLASIATERANLQKTFAGEFPDYAALSNPLPLMAKEIQALLSGDEAMVMFSVVDRESYVFALTREGFDWKPLSLGSEALSQKVAAFRRGLDVSQASDASGKPGLFDLALANELYADAARSGGGAGEGQAQSAGGAVRGADRAAVPSAGDGKAGCRNPRNNRRLSRCRMVAQAPRGRGVAVGREPEGAARVRAPGSGASR